MKTKLLLLLIGSVTTPLLSMELQNNQSKRDDNESILKANLMKCIELQTKQSTLQWADNDKDESLFKAVLVRDLIAVKESLSNGANIEARCAHGIDAGMPILSFACSSSDSLIVQHLLSAGADCNALDEHGLPPLYHALQILYTPHCISKLDALVRNGANIGIQKKAPAYTFTKEGATPLHRMVEILSNTRFGDKDKRKEYDINTAEEAFERLKLILTMMVTEVIRQAHREGKPKTWESKLSELFAIKDADGKAAYQLFEKYDDFNQMSKRPFPGTFYHPETKQHNRWDKLDYQLFTLLDPEHVCQYQYTYHLTEKVRKERERLK